MPAPDLSEQIIRLETTVAHLERQLEQMHSVLLEVQNELKRSRDHVSKLERRIQLASEIPDVRDPLDERPPHY